MRTTITIKKILPLLLAALFMASCAGAPAKPEFDLSLLVWPLPPETPRVKYVAIYSNNRDVEKQGFAASLLGEDRPRLALAFPRAVAADGEGKIYVSHRLGVVVFDTVKRDMRQFGNQPGRELRAPRGIAIGPDGRVYIADSSRKTVMVYSPDNKFLMQIGSNEGFEKPMGVAIDPSRSRLYVSDAKKHMIHAYDLDGRSLFSIENDLSMPDEQIIYTPLQLAVNSRGNIYVVNALRFSVNVYSPEGKFIRRFGKIGDAPGHFARPKGIAIDSEDNVYVTDSAFQNVQIFNSEGRLLLFFSEGGSNPGYLRLPGFMHIDKHDRIYIAERPTHRVQVFQHMGDLYYREHPEVERPKPPPEEPAPAAPGPERSSTAPLHP